MKKLLLLALFMIAIGATQTTFAQELENNCVIGAKITDRDPNGLNVRSKPNVSGKIVTKLKHGNDGKYIVYVVGYSNGWVKIGGANDGSVDVSKAQGWVSAKMIAVTAGENANLTSKPNLESTVLTTVPAGTSLQVVGYECLKAKVVYNGKTGWLSSMR